MEFSPSQDPHRRLNPLTGEWVLVSPHRTQRPWLGQQEPASDAPRPEHDPGCYLCPGNKRANGETNPTYSSTFVFTNDYPAVVPGSRHEFAGGGGANLRWSSVQGECRVVCFSPRHDLTLAEMDSGGIRHVVDEWGRQTEELGDRYRWVQVFENKGEAMGCSNPHPHGQVWATDTVPTLVAQEDDRQAAYKKGNLLLDCLAEELADGSRVVEQNEHWALLVPFWAVWPFEYLLVPKRHVLRLPDLKAHERFSLASILKLGLVRYDNLFQTSFPYSMGWHGAPFGEGHGSHWQLHAHFYPPLLRSAAVRKFMVGYEMLAEPQRDITPEQAAARLRDVPAEHYRTA